jgi:hypothetical protein
MKVTVAYTYELDDSEKAFNELSEQIAEGGALMKNTVGIMFCHYEFVLSGVAGDICKRLPFPIVGGTTTLAGINLPLEDMEEMSNAEFARKADEQFRLAVAVISADDVDFVTVKTPALTVDSDLKTAARETFGGFEKPVFVTAFLPSIIFTDADTLVRETIKAVGGAPVFGGTSVDDSPTYIENCFVFEGGEVYNDRAVYLLMYGNVHPRFATTVVQNDKFLPNSGIITKARKREILEINDRPVTDFTNSIGLRLTNSPDDNVFAIVLMITDKDGNVYGRSVMHLSEDNGLFVGGEVNVGDTVRVAMFEKKGVIGASAKVTEQMVKDNPDASLAIVTSCETRHILLGSELMDGERMLRIQCGDLPFMLSYAGGEIAPIGKCNCDSEYVTSSILNQSFCICLI